MKKHASKELTHCMFCNVVDFLSAGDFYEIFDKKKMGAQWLSGRVLDSRSRSCGFQPHQGHCVVSLSKTH